MKIYILLWIILLTGFVSGELEISQIMYDASGIDEGFEFIEIHNNGNESVLLGNYSLAYDSGTGFKDIWNGECNYCNIKPNSFYIIGENNESDYYVNLNLLNTRGAIRLNKGVNNIDLVGYGETLIFEGLPASNVISGKSLLRIDNTGNNFADFIESDVLIRNQKENVVSINVLNAIPNISTYSSIIVGESSFLTINASDLNGDEDLQMVEINCSNNLFNLSYSNLSEISCKDYSFRLWDNLEPSSWLNVESEKMFEIISINGCNALPGQKCNIEIEAKANLLSEVELGIDNLYKGSKKIVVNSTKQELFEIGETKIINFEFDLPTGLSVGEYTGEITLNIQKIN